MNVCHRPNYINFLCHFSFSCFRYYSSYYSIQIDIYIYIYNKRKVQVKRSQARTVYGQRRSHEQERTTYSMTINYKDKLRGFSL
jgi:hypothetical protein